VAKQTAKKEAVARKGEASRPQLDLFGEGAAEAPAPKRGKPHAEAPSPAPPASEPATRAPEPRRPQRVTAETLAQKQREISVSEFFVKNRHLLGFDNPSKALLTTIKEAVDNSLDACEEAGILPELHVEVHDLGLEAKKKDAELTKGEGRFLVVVQDNGPGIVKAQVPKIFGKLLYGSKFHRLKQSVTADQPVLVERGGRMDRVPIGPLVDRLLSEGSEVADVSERGIRVPAFDPATWSYAWRPVSHVIRHRLANEVLEVRTERGKSVRVTGCHSLFTYDAASRRVREVEARSLRPGDYIVAPRRLPEPTPLHDLNLLAELGLGDVAGRQVFVYGVPDRVFESLARTWTVVHRRARARSRRFLRLAAPDGTTVDLLDDSWAQYRRRGFLPAHLVKRLGLEAACSGGRLRTYHHGAVTETPVTWALDRALMRLLGLYVAEGHGDRRHVGLTFSSRETALVEEVRTTARGLSLKSSVEQRPRNAVRVKLFGGLTSLLFPAWCGRGARNKKAPWFVAHAGRDLRQHFLDGLYQGDGHRVKNRETLTLSSASRGLVDDVETLWLLQGVVPARRGPFRQRGLGREISTAWVLDVYGFDIGASLTFSRRPVAQRHNRYRLFPTRMLSFAGPRAGVRVPAEAGAILQAAGLGTGPSGSAKAVGIVMGTTLGASYGLAELTGLAGGRVTRHLTNHLVEQGYLAAASGGSFQATPKVEAMRREVDGARSFAASDLCLLRVDEVRPVDAADVYVYDLSVPGCENFVAGDGALACHNSRGQQGIGISAAAMYGQLTTGKPIRVTSRVGKRKDAHVFDIQIDTRKNEPVVTHDETLAEWHQEHGTRVELEIVANWQQGQRFVNRYVEHTALANPHATLHYTRPVGAGQRSAGASGPGNETIAFPRATDELPKEALEIKPHPHGVELGALMLMARESKSRDVRGFLQTSFSRVSSAAAGEILAKVPWGKKPVRPRTLGENRAMAEELHKALGETKLMSPPTNCLSPIGDELMRRGLVSFLNVIESEGGQGDENAQLDLDAAAMKPAKKAAKGRAKAEAAPAPQAVPDAPAEEGVERIKGHNYFIATVTRSPKVYRGNPFQVEVGLAYGGSWPPDKTIELFRFANRVPLLFQRGACGVTEAIVRTDWRNYLLSQPKGSLPVGPMALLVHIASVWVPFTSESKEAVAHYPDILKEIQLAAQECGRKLATFIRKRKAADYQAQRRSIFELYIEEVAQAIGKITGRKPAPIKRDFLRVARKVTAAEMEEEEKALELEAREAKKKTAARAEAEED
jgi:DNA topoisomerase-6 subunit B